MDLQNKTATSRSSTSASEKKLRDRATHPIPTSIPRARPTRPSIPHRRMRSGMSSSLSKLFGLAIPLAVHGSPTSFPSYTYSGTNFICDDTVNFGYPRGGSYSQGGSAGIPTPTSLTDCFQYCSGLSTCSGFWHQIYYNSDGTVSSHQCGYFSEYISSPPYDSVDEFYYAGNGGAVCKNMVYTASPTSSPAPSISTPPSALPTAVPSSSAPSPLPIPAPSPLPSPFPTTSPVPAPTPLPIPAPTLRPTQEPSPLPTGMGFISSADRARLVPTILGAVLVCTLAAWFS